MAIGGQRGRIDPSDVSVGTAVNQVNAPMSGVAEHHHRGTGEVEFHHRFAYRKPFERGGRLRDDHRIERRDFLVAFMFGCGDDVA